MRIARQLAAMAAACFVSTAPAWAINKCVGSDGKAVFQDQPCADGRGGKIDVRPASGMAPAAPPVMSTTPASGAARQKTQLERDQEMITQYQRDSRIGTLEARLIPDSKNALYRKRSQCDAEIQALQARKMSANNNLAGATWEQSLSTEMQAVSSRCDTEYRFLQDEVSRFERELSDLKAQRSR